MGWRAAGIEENVRGAAAAGGRIDGGEGRVVRYRVLFFRVR
jgi:hypothetical protein